MKRYIKPFIHATFFENQKLMAGSLAKHNEVGSKAQLGKETINMDEYFYDTTDDSRWENKDWI